MAGVGSAGCQYLRRKQISVVGAVCQTAPSAGPCGLVCGAARVRRECWGRMGFSGIQPDFVGRDPQPGPR